MLNTTSETKIEPWGHKCMNCLEPYRKQDTAMVATTAQGLLWWHSVYIKGRSMGSCGYREH